MCKELIREERKAYDYENGKKGSGYDNDEW